MRRSPLMFLLCATFGCHADVAATPQAVSPTQAHAAAAESEAPAEVEQPDLRGAAARPTAPQAMTRPAWSWDHYGPEAIRRGAHERRSLDVGPATITLEIGVKPERVVIKRALKLQPNNASGRTYTMDPSPFVSGSSLLRVPAAPGLKELIVVAVYSRIASGCALVALDAETGAVRWQTALTALGPIDHSKYRNDVQLAVVSGQIVVYGDEASGRYIEVVDSATGRTLHNIKPDARGAAWGSWAENADAAGREALREELEARWEVGVRDSGVRRVIAMLSGTGPTWSVMLGNTQDDRELEVAASEQAPFLPTQVAAHVDTAAILYTAPDGAAGNLASLNGATGEERWRVPLAGFGAAKGAAGKLRVTPWTDSFVVTEEGAAGASLEIVDASSGQVVWHERVFP